MTETRDKRSGRDGSRLHFDSRKVNWRDINGIFKGFQVAGMRDASTNLGIFDCRKFKYMLIDLL